MRKKSLKHVINWMLWTIRVAFKLIQLCGPDKDPHIKRQIQIRYSNNNSISVDFEQKFLILKKKLCDNVDVHKFIFTGFTTGLLSSFYNSIKRGIFG